MQDIEIDDAAKREPSVWLRERLEALRRIYEWDMEKRPVQAGYNPSEVQLYCVRNAEWQEVRLSMKGKDTYEKLAICEAWWDAKMDIASRMEFADAFKLRKATEIQVGNYLGALRRGGQLNDDNQIRKAR